jgi:hypothetical protein
VTLHNLPVGPVHPRTFLLVDSGHAIAPSSDRLRAKPRARDFQPRRGRPNCRDSHFTGSGPRHATRLPTCRRCRLPVQAFPGRQGRGSPKNAPSDLNENEANLIPPDVHHRSPTYHVVSRRYSPPDTGQPRSAATACITAPGSGVRQVGSANPDARPGAGLKNRFDGARLRATRWPSLGYPHRRAEKLTVLCVSSFNICIIWKLTYIQTFSTLKLYM